MNIGTLDQRISIYSTTTVADGAGGFETPTATLVATVWASIIQKSKPIGFEAGKVSLVNVNEITIRTQAATISRNHYIMDGTRKMSIESVIVEKYYTKIIANYEG